MDHYSILDRNAEQTSEPSLEQNSDLAPSDKTPENDPTDLRENDLRENGLQETDSLSDALQFPGDDGGQSLAAMAERDLDATLQLLADRAQYITGSSGAAIALRRGEHNDMLCRATSAGSNAPELGALLSTEFGLSGESVRTRLPLRCDDAERDPRVNREGCRQLGIASVVVMPIISDEIVLGVFELFSGKVDAFDERDLSALQRLSEMVETAVKLAHAAEHLSADILTPAVQEHEYFSSPDPESNNFSAQSSVPQTQTEIQEEGPQKVAEEEVPQEIHQDGISEAADISDPIAEVATQASAEVHESPKEIPAAASVPVPPAAKASPPKPLFWSADLASPAVIAPADQSHIPLVLRKLHKCQACGFPVSEGRTLCVECEDKKFRGRPLGPPAVATSPVIMKEPANSNVETIKLETTKLETVNATTSNATITHVEMPDAPAPSVQAQMASPTAQPANESSTPSADIAFLSSTINSQQSWFSANKYILGALAAAAAAVAALALFR